MRIRGGPAPQVLKVQNSQVNLQLKKVKRPRRKILEKRMTNLTSKNAIESGTGRKNKILKRHIDMKGSANNCQPVDKCPVNKSPPTRSIKLDKSGCIPMPCFKRSFSSLRSMPTWPRNLNIIAKFKTSKITRTAGETSQTDCGVLNLTPGPDVTVI